MNAGRTHWWNRYVPAHINNPFRLVYRLLSSGNRAARSAMLQAAAGFGLMPIDLLLRRRERRLYASAQPPHKPVIIVVGPPRSGTTLVAQYLINTFDVCYLNNLTALFPKSPITANVLFGRMAKLGAGDYDAFYGKSRGLSGANDGLHIWDRWLGSDRDRVPEQLQGDALRTMPQFFGALEAHYGIPLVNKVNRLNTCANLVADCLPGAWFICLKRDPLYLAQSLYVAREQISGDLDTPYGTLHSGAARGDPVEDVCRQVAYHEGQASRQQALLGRERFSVVEYEEFCKRPADFARSIAAQHPVLRLRDAQPPNATEFGVSRKSKLPERILDQMKESLSNLETSKVSLRLF
jgi:hypothetical protein